MVRILSNCSVDTLAFAARSIKNGALVAFPTETVYGLGADACNELAVDLIYKVKGRPKNHPVIIHIAHMRYLEQWISSIPEYAISLANAFWPGPITLVLQRSELAKDFITGGQNTVAVRIPDNPIALGFLNAFHELGGAGVVAPSANRFGKVSPTSASAVNEELGSLLTENDLLIDGGESEVGLESTIVDCTFEAPKILRPGAITIEMIEDVTGLEICKDSDWRIEDSGRVNTRVSGSLENHYAPIAKVVLDKEPLSGCGFIALESVETPPGVIRLAAPSSLEDFARVLYAALREGDQKKISTVYVAQPAGDGIAIAIRDRLLRASGMLKVKE